MVVNESIPMVKIEEVELNRSKEETESYRAELNKWNEEINELRPQKEDLEKEKKAESSILWICQRKISNLFVVLVLKLSNGF